MVTSIAATATVTAPAPVASASGGGKGGFAGMISGLLDLPTGTNGHGGIPPLAQIAASAVSSLALANPFGFASTLFMGFAKELLEMGPDTSRPPVPAGMSVTGQEAGVQPVTPGTLKPGEYTTLATVTPDFLAGAPGRVVDGGHGQEGDVTLAGLPGVSLPVVAAPPAAGPGASAVMLATASEQGMSVGLPAAPAAPSPVGAAPSGSPVQEAGAATATPDAAGAAGAAAPGVPAASRVADAAPPRRPAGWAAAYSGMSEWQRAQAVERGLA